MAKKITATDALHDLHIKVHSMALNNQSHTAFIGHVQQHINAAMSQITKQLEFDLYGYIPKGNTKIRRNKGFVEVKYYPFDYLTKRLLIINED